MSNFTPAWFKKGFFNESLFCDDFLSTHQLLYSNGAFFTPDGRMVDPMPLRCEIFEMMREYVGANLAKKVTNVVDVQQGVPRRERPASLFWGHDEPAPTAIGKLA